MNNSVIVYGWYGKNNIGDELFKEAFSRLFPDLHFEFTDKIRVAALKNAAAVFIGGGSFLFSSPNMEAGALEILKQKKLFYIGVGVETDIHPIHKELMRSAKFIATRSVDSDVILNSLNENYKFFPDIVYSLQDSVQISTKIDKSILVVPNISVVPKWDDPHWKHASWHYFKSEFAQFLDELASQKYKIGFFPMCTNSDTDDRWAAYEIISHMKNRRQTEVVLSDMSSVPAVTSIWSQYQTIITQRFHGIVLAEMI
jgi:polysaccharide pyruvyl transferase WcaK-like protein